MARGMAKLLDPVLFQYPTTGSNDWNAEGEALHVLAQNLSVPYHRVKRLELLAHIAAGDATDFQYPTTGSNDWNQDAVHSVVSLRLHFQYPTTGSNDWNLSHEIVEDGGRCPFSTLPPGQTTGTPGRGWLGWPSSPFSTLPPGQTTGTQWRGRRIRLVVDFQYPTTGSNDWNACRRSTGTTVSGLSVPYHRVKRLEPVTGLPQL